MNDLRLPLTDDGPQSAETVPVLDWLDLAAHRQRGDFDTGFM
jgi:hypothetical protein